MTCCEDYNLKVFGSLGQAFHDIRSNVDACVYRFLAFKLYFEDDVRLLLLDVVNTMDQSLVHVKNQKFFLVYWVSRSRQVYVVFIIEVNNFESLFYML